MFFMPHGEDEYRKRGDNESQERDRKEEKEFSDEDEENFKKELTKKAGLYEAFLRHLEEEKEKDHEKEVIKKEIIVDDKEKKYIPSNFKVIAFEFDALLRARPSEEKFEIYFQKLIDEKLKSGELNYGEELKLFDYLKENFKEAEKIIDKVSSKYSINMTSEEERKEVQDKIPTEALYTNDQLRQFNMQYSNEIVDLGNELETKNAIKIILSSGIAKYRLPSDQKSFLNELRKINSSEKSYFNNFVDKILEEKVNELKKI